MRSEEDADLEHFMRSWTGDHVPSFGPKSMSRYIELPSAVLPERIDDNTHTTLIPCPLSMTNSGAIPEIARPKEK
jgi:hypothetical protein